MRLKKIPLFGDRDTGEVKLLQKALLDKGFNPGEVDDWFGKKTKYAVSLFQTSIGMPATGNPGIQTMTALGFEVGGYDDKPAKPQRPELNRDLVATMIIAIVQKDVNNKLRESGGKNRGTRIDSFNKRAGAPLGSPYCASGLWAALDDVCKELGFKNPMVRTASSQAFAATAFIPAKYMRTKAEDMGKKGDFSIFRKVSDANHGHIAILTKDQKKQPLFETAEYNTDGSGSRDGDGAYNMTRSTLDRSIQNAGKLFVQFTDIPQWVLDYNS